MRITSTLILALVSSGAMACAEAPDAASGDDPAMDDGSSGDTTSTAESALSQIRVFHDLQTGRCLDSDQAGAGYTLGCNGGRFQSWILVARGGDVFTLKDLATSRCLDVNSSGWAYTATCNHASSQNWHMKGTISEGPVLYNFVDVATGRCLDSNDAGQLYTLPCNGGGFQYWR